MSNTFAFTRGSMPSTCRAGAATTMGATAIPSSGAKRGSGRASTQGGRRPAANSSSYSRGWRVRLPSASCRTRRSAQACGSSPDRERSLASQLQNRSVVHYRALIVVPHDVSELSLTALYRMNIPMFVPSAKLLTTWCEQGYALTARRISQPPRETGIIRAPVDTAPDPNLQTRATLAYWLPLVDANVLPHLIRSIRSRTSCFNPRAKTSTRLSSGPPLRWRAQRRAEEDAFSEWASILRRARGGPSPQGY